MVDKPSGVENERNPIAAKRISYSERFEKTRLAVLSYSAIAAVLAIAAHGKEASTGLVAGAPALSVNAVILLSLIAACAYVVVFLLSEIPTSSALNTVMFDGVTWATLHERENEVSRQIEQLDDGSKRLAAAGSEAIISFGRQVDGLLNHQCADTLFEALKYHEDMSLAGRAAVASLEKLPKQRFDDMWLKFTNATKEFERRAEAIDRMPELLSTAQTATAALREQLAVEADLLRDAVERVTSYSSALDPIEKHRFQLWDCGIPVAFYFFACAAAGARGLHWLPLSVM